MKPLPDKPSELIRLALADLRECEADERYDIWMASWHAPERNGICRVCLAGAVMAKSLDAPIDRFLCPSEGDDGYYALLALDEFRVGNISGGLAYLGHPVSPLHTRFIHRYHTDRNAFHFDMENLATDLAQAGL